MDLHIISEEVKMRAINTEVIENKLYSMILDANCHIEKQAERRLTEALKTETKPLSLFALEKLIENNKIATEKKVPVCQDTGYAVVVLEVGDEVRFEGKFIVDAVNDGVRRAYEDGYFRKSVCDPLSRKNTADNTPCALTTEYVRGDKVTIKFMAKGFGSENMSRIYMLNPNQSVDGVLDCIVKTAAESGSNPCPPTIIGVGIGGTFDKCALLAKKALMRGITSFNGNSEYEYIEREALLRINNLGIGAGGFGGDISCLKVNVEYMPTHIAGLPVAVNVQCHCARTAEAVI